MPVAVARREFAKSLIDRAIRRAAKALDPKSRRAFADLLWKVKGRSEMLRPARAVGRVEADRVGRLLGAMTALVSHRRDWLRPADGWEPEGFSPLSLFSSLAHHLLADYPVPPVLLSAWFGDDGWHARRRQNWFKHAGRGESLRTARLPLALTRRMVHEFAHAPAQFPIEFALRWAQVRGLGGSDELARAVAAGRLGREFHSDAFWVTVIHLFINAPRLDLSHIAPVVEYLHHQRCENQRVLIDDDTMIVLSPPQPNLSVKGCTMASLLRRATEWQASRTDGPVRRYFRWDPSEIGAFRKEGDDGRAWTVRELLDSNDLAAEGKAMHHCVADYTYVCLERKSTIWSLGVEGPDGRERLATIEVNPATREVIQAQALQNERPDAVSLGLIAEWAACEGLKVEEPPVEA